MGNNGASITWSENMTRNQPQAPPYDYSQGGGYGYGFQQPQYGGNEPAYGNYNPGETYGQPGNWQQPQYGADASGSAQSYYGSNVRRTAVSSARLLAVWRPTFVSTIQRPSSGQRCRRFQKPLRAAIWPHRSLI